MVFLKKPGLVMGKGYDANTALKTLAISALSAGINGLMEKWLSSVS
ncbi:MAG: hypothetical protein BWY72_02109 [Bacteroidetes bacterium ADurb.Bin416]|nr:MAG: hypothetical protein BWY72_02109 [Bacteroidetes bacterium ADurb.Bin416]